MHGSRVRDEAVHSFRIFRRSLDPDPRPADAPSISFHDRPELRRKVFIGHLDINPTLGLLNQCPRELETTRSAASLDHGLMKGRVHSRATDRPVRFGTSGKTITLLSSALVSVFRSLDDSVCW